MRKKLLFLALALVAAAASFQTPAVASGTHACPICTTYADGSKCCVSCICNDQGGLVACTNHFCPPAGGGA